MTFFLRYGAERLFSLVYENLLISSKTLNGENNSLRVKMITGNEPIRTIAELKNTADCCIFEFSNSSLYFSKLIHTIFYCARTFLFTIFDFHNYHPI